VLTPILFAVNLLVTLLLVLVIGHIWKTLSSMAVIMIYVSSYMGKKFDDFHGINLTENKEN